MDIASKKGDNSFGREIQYKVSDPFDLYRFLKIDGSFDIKILL